MTDTGVNHASPRYVVKKSDRRYPGGNDEVDIEHVGGSESDKQYACKMDKTKYYKGSEPSSKEHGQRKIDQHLARAYTDEYRGQIEHHPERGVKGRDKEAVRNDPNCKNPRCLCFIML